MSLSFEDIDSFIVVCLYWLHINDLHRLRYQDYLSSKDQIQPFFFLYFDKLVVKCFRPGEMYCHLNCRKLIEISGFAPYGGENVKY